MRVVLLVIDLSTLDKFLSMQRTEIAMSALNISPINEMYSSSQIICRPPTSYPHPSLPPTLQIQTIAIILDRGPPLHQQGGRRLQMWLLSSIEITPIQSSSSAGLTLCIMKNIKSKVNQTLDILKKKKKAIGCDTHNFQESNF